MPTSYQNYLQNPMPAGFGNASAIYGRVPNPTIATQTAPGATKTAMATGNQVYGQLPNYSGSLANVGGNIASETAGQVPADVLRLLQEQGAERGVATGAVGSPNSNASYLQALGLTSLGLEQQGQSNLQSILPELPGYNISQNPNFFVSSGEQLASQQSNANLAAAPNPAAAGQAAVGAVQTGMSVGQGSVPTPAPIQYPLSPAYTQPLQPVTSISGSGVNTGWNSALNTASMTQNQVNQILQQYNPLNTDTSSPWGGSEEQSNQIADLAQSEAPSWMGDYLGAGTPAPTAGGDYYGGDGGGF